MKEQLIRTVNSELKKCRIGIVWNSSGLIELHKYVKRYDEDERLHYDIRETPNPSGLFDDQIAATKEAERILNE